MLEVLENAHRCVGDSKDTLDRRFDRVRHALVREVEGFVRMDFASEVGLLNRIHLLTNAFALIEKRQNVVNPGEDECNNREVTQIYLNQLRRVTRLLSIGEHRFNHRLSQEEAAELLLILSREVGCGRTIKNPDIVHVSVAQPLDVSSFLANNSLPTKVQARTLRAELESRMANRLRELSSANPSQELK